ncbi:MAG UNVERIFIED_CONTAM: hypothetical protein LVR18_52320 [Planctomycetaceae bacterium]
MLATQSIFRMAARPEDVLARISQTRFLGQIGNRFIGRLECPETAEVAGHG